MNLSYSFPFLARPYISIALIHLWPRNQSRAGIGDSRCPFNWSPVVCRLPSIAFHSYIYTPLPESFDARGCTIAAHRETLRAEVDRGRRSSTDTDHETPPRLVDQSMSPFSTKDLMEGHHGRREDLLARVVCIGSSSSLLGAYYSSDGGGVFATGSAVPLGVTCFSGSGDGGRRIYDVPVPPTYLKEHSATHLVIQIGDRSSRGLRGSGKGDIAATFSTITVELKSLHRLRRRPADITRRLEVVTTAWDRHTRKDGKHSRSAVAWLVKVRQAPKSRALSCSHISCTRLIVQRSKHSNTPPTILIYDKPDLSNLMRDIPDETSWADLALAGTHDSTAFYGAPYAQCQTRGTSITEQLMDGQYTS